MSRHEHDRQGALETSRKAAVDAGVDAAAFTAQGDRLVGAPLFHVRNLTFRRGEGFRLAIDELTLAPGEKLAIVGHNGSGKTTLLRILAGLETAAAGSTVARLAGARIGFLKQEPYLFNESVARNLAYPLKVRRAQAAEVKRRVAETLALIGLEHAAARLPQHLSGGERKRLALGRVLIARPEVLLLDEPDAYLDQRSQEVIEEILSATTASLVLTTHDLRFAYRVAKRLMHLRDGRVSSGLPANVLTGEATGEKLRLPGGLEILLGAALEAGPRRISLDPRHLVISRTVLDSSMRNQLRGRVAAAHDQQGSVWVDVTLGGPAQETGAGPVVTAIISRESYEALGLNLNQEVYVSFKAHAVDVL